MKWSPILIGNLAFLGPNKKPAGISFKKGINVICGASDTGKSFIVEALDFALGSSKPLRDIPERVGYDHITFDIVDGKNKNYKLLRSTSGGDYQLLEETTKEGTVGNKLSAKHKAGDNANISGWLLSKIGLYNKSIKTNAKGKTRSFSFRDLARLIIVQEEEIIRQSSPFLSGQYTSKTSELSALKLLLTGTDDSALVEIQDVSIVNASVTAKVELIELWLDDLWTELRDLEVQRSEVEEQFEQIESSINSEREHLEYLQQDFSIFSSSRYDIYLEKEKVSDRINELKQLLYRFGILSHHYEVDIKRLTAIKESGSLFVHQESTSCPVCGALPEHQHLKAHCDGDIETIVAAANVEIEKVSRLANELKITVSDLNNELKELNQQFAEVQNRFSEVEERISKVIIPSIKNSQQTYSALVDKKSDLKKAIDLFDKYDQLKKQKEDLLEEPVNPISNPLHEIELSKTIYNDLSKIVEQLLKAWNFPNPERVYFDEKLSDFVINGIPRGSRGKGLRAITHAAVTLGLLEYCKEKSLPHPGLIIIDSPLLSYYAPEGKDDDLAGSGLKEKFYEYLVKEHSEDQIVIIENEHPQDELLESIQLLDFTKNPVYGRYGLFPPLS